MKNLIYILIVFALVLSSCTDIVELELHEEDYDILIVDGEVTTLYNAYVYLTKSIKVSEDTSNPSVSNVVVSISDDATPSNKVTLVESKTTPGLYTVPNGESYIGVVGRTYTLKIIYENDTIKASDKLYEVPDIDTLVVKASARGKQQFLGLFISLQEQADIANFYKWDIYINNECIDDIDHLIISDDKLYVGNYVDSVEIFTDEYYEDEDRLINYLDSVYVEQISMSPQVYDYYYALMMQHYTGTPFSVPPANTPTNITTTGSGDVAGLFRTHDISVSNGVKVDSTIESQLKNYDSLF